MSAQTVPGSWTTCEYMNRSGTHPALITCRVALAVAAHVDQPHVIGASVGLDDDAGIGVRSIDEPSAELAWATREGHLADRWRQAACSQGREQSLLELGLRRDLCAASVVQQRRQRGHTRLARADDVVECAADSRPGGGPTLDEIVGHLAQPIVPEARRQVDDRAGCRHHRQPVGSRAVARVHVIYLVDVDARQAVVGAMRRDQGDGNRRQTGCPMQECGRLVGDERPGARSQDGDPQIDAPSWGSASEDIDPRVHPLPDTAPQAPTDRRSP